MKTARNILIIVLFLVMCASFAMAADKKSDRLKAGDTAPVFQAKDFNGKLIDLKELQKNGPVVLVFLRGFG